MDHPRNTQSPQVGRPKSILAVCTSCRPSGTPREPKENRPGFRLYEELLSKLRESALQDRLQLKPVDCLSLCPRPCGIALTSRGKWSYLFGDQAPSATAEDILECAALYLESTDGAMPRARRPQSLQAAILGRVPPLQL